MTQQPKTPAEFAAAESRAARKTWDQWGNSSTQDRPSIADRVVPYIGSGMLQREVAAELGCNRQTVSKALKELGAKL